MANHEQDRTARTGPPADADRDEQPAAGLPGPVPAGSGPSGPGGTDEGTFRWPSTGLPRLFGQPADDQPGDDGAGVNGQDGVHVPPQPDMYPQADVYPETDVYPQADAYRQAGARERPDPFLPPPGFAQVPEDHYPAGEYDPLDGFDTGGDEPVGLAPGWHGMAAAADEEPAPVSLPRGEPPHWRRAETADSLTVGLLLRDRPAPPPPGWRRAVYRATGGLINPQQSAVERHRRELITRACAPVATGHHRVAVLSLKGGVGKTTTVMGLGSTLSSLRGDRVIAVDANPDRGTLSDKIRLETAATVRDLLNERDQILRYADVRAFTTRAPSRLEVLASDRDPAISVAFSDWDYQDVAQVLEHFYSVCITDCGTGLLHSAMAAVLRLADQIVLVSSPSVDGARSASATLDWLQAHGYGDLVRDAVVVLSVIRPRNKSTVDLGRLEQHFTTRCRAVVRIPHDAHLEEGAEVNLPQLSRATADAYLTLAAEVGDAFGWPRRAQAT